MDEDMKQEVGEENGERLQRLEDSVQLLKMQVDFLAKVMVDLTEKTENFTKDIDRKLERLLLVERKRNDKLLVAYAQLKVKYNYLLKAVKGRRAGIRDQGSGRSEDEKVRR